eukprot:7949218-Alexandrium_andersonii.AAC.1
MEGATQSAPAPLRNHRHITDHRATAPPGLASATVATPPQQNPRQHCQHPIIYYSPVRRGHHLPPSWQCTCPNALPCHPG